MISRTNREWDVLYRSTWRHRFAHLSKAIRGKVVRGCLGKAAYETNEEATEVAATLPRRGKLVVNAYECLLCGSFHIGNSRTKPMKERTITGERSV